MHLNVKACVHHDLQPRFLELYLGRKYYQHPAESVRLDLRFDSERTEKALRARLTADAGPYGTSQYEFVLTAIDAGSDVFVELKLSNDEGYAGGLIDLYLNTLGRYKVGFTEVGKSMFGNTKYITGQEGAAERNVVRYMYALSVSLERSKEPFDERAKAWFDATERHPRQLQELERDRYLAIKQREYENQLLYQRAADRGEVIELEKPTKNR
ncbi:MAG: hypothetical protein DWQ08_15060 [Proteobacteria bacterium]|nr:MAG: hypothetical protein DWQ08_15060 [Pseudomonadota bacterium]